MCGESFIKACSNGHCTVAKWLLETEPNINVSVNNHEAFHSACENGHIEVSRWLEELLPEKYSVGDTIYTNNNWDSDDESDEPEELLNEDGDIITKFSYDYTILKSINITKIILEKDVPKQLEQCNICLDIQSNVYTNCGHLYCKSCILRWLKTHDSCPCCRETLIDESLSNIES